jgi:outer membrane lipoprotein-sorting protein
LVVCAFAPRAVAQESKAAAPSAPAAKPAVPAKAAPAAKTWTKEEAAKVLKLAEEIRCLDKAEVRVDLKTVDAGRETVYDMRILRSTEDRAYVEFLAPADERGRKMLAKGKNYWSTFPDSKRVTAISRREMIGNSVFALADLFQLNAETDYDATIVASEKDAAGVELLKLDLKGKHDEVPYNRIEYWVEAKDYFPVKAKFFGVSGKHLKSLDVETRATIAGRVRPEMSKMIDEVVTGRASWWKTKSMVVADPPDSVFTKEYLKGGG